MYSGHIPRCVPFLQPIVWDHSDIKQNETTLEKSTIKNLLVICVDNSYVSLPLQSNQKYRCKSFHTLYISCMNFTLYMEVAVFSL